MIQPVFPICERPRTRELVLKDKKPNNGNVLSQTITVPAELRNGTSYNGFTATQTYTYDSLNRIKDAKEVVNASETWKQTFSYDRYGNRSFDEVNTSTLPKNCNGAVCPVDNPTTNQMNNRLNNFIYDNAGNMIKDGQNRKYSYNAENKQTKVETLDANGTPISTNGEYFYDGQGKRVKKIAGLEVTIFVYDAQDRLVAEYSNQSTNNPEVNYLTTDNLGSSRISTDKNGQVTARHDYQPFGEEIQRASYGTDGVRKKFTGYERDNESNLDFAKARYHSYNLGRFQSPDPIIVSKVRIKNPQIWNSYSYAGNNPLRYTDPSGLERIELGDDEETIKRAIKAKKEEKKAIENDKTLNKTQREQKKAEINGQLKNLETKLDGTRLVNAILADLDSIGERNGLQLSDFSLTTDPQRDFAGVSAENMRTIMQSQAFHRGGKSIFELTALNVFLMRLPHKQILIFVPIFYILRPQLFLTSNIIN